MEANGSELQAVLDKLENEGQIQADVVRRWAASPDSEIRARAFLLLWDSPTRVVNFPPFDARLFFVSFLSSSIRLDPQSAYAINRWDAAEFARCWFLRSWK